jgi:hypothetical protein
LSDKLGEGVAEAERDKCLRSGGASPANMAKLAGMRRGPEA